MVLLPDSGQPSILRDQIWQLGDPATAPTPAPLTNGHYSVAPLPGTTMADVKCLKRFIPLRGVSPVAVTATDPSTGLPCVPRPPTPIRRHLSVGVLRGEYQPKLMSESAAFV